MTVEQVYFPEETDVWLVPKIGTFQGSADGYQTFDEYLATLKPHILEKELGAFGFDSSDDMPGPWTAELFDQFFELEIHDRARKAPM